MKLFRVWTHEGVPPFEVVAPNQKEAVKAGVEAMKGVMIPGGYFGAEHAGSDGPAFIPARPATPLEKPYARVKPKGNRPFRRFGF